MKASHRSTRTSKYASAHLKFRLSKCEGYVSVSDHVLQVRNGFRNILFSILFSTFICLFIVMQNRVMKYITKIGQKTGMLKNSKKEHTKAIDVALVAEYQNLNSGSRLMKGRNSSFCEVGRPGPSSSASNSAMAGSILGVRNASRRFKW